MLIGRVGRSSWEPACRARDSGEVAFRAVGAPGTQRTPPPIGPVNGQANWYQLPGLDRGPPSRLTSSGGRGGGPVVAAVAAHPSRAAGRCRAPARRTSHGTLCWRSSCAGRHPGAVDWAVRGCRRKRLHPGRCAFWHRTRQMRLRCDRSGADCAPNSETMRMHFTFTFTRKTLRSRLVKW
jgi:hypothetical protein